MARIFNSNSIALPAPFQAGSSDPVDARIVVEKYTDLTTPSTFGTILNGTVCLIYEGITVYVREHKACYTYMGPMSGNGVLSTEVQKTTNWIKTADFSNPSDKILSTGTDKVLTIDLAANTISTTLELDWSPDSKKLRLLGKPVGDNSEKSVVSEINASDFVKDGMLDDVKIVGANLLFTFNTDAGKSVIPVPISDFISSGDLVIEPKNTIIKNNDKIVNLMTLTGVDTSSDSMQLYTKDLIDERLSWYEA